MLDYVNKGLGILIGKYFVQNHLDVWCSATAYLEAQTLLI